MKLISHKHRSHNPELPLSGKYELKLDTDNFSLEEILPELEETIRDLKKNYQTRVSRNQNS
jgi:hypothetical protein